MKLLLLLISTALLAQQAEPVKPAPPTTVTVRIVVDGVATKYDLKPAAIETLNNLFHAGRFQGTFADRYIGWLKATLKELAKRPDFAPSAAKAKLDAIQAAQQQLQAEADAVAEEKQP